MNSIFRPDWFEAPISSADRVRALCAARTFHDMGFLGIAARLCRAGHEGQTDKTGEPYLNHPNRVARAVGEAGGSKVAIALAYLHDVVEDTDLSLDEIMFAFEYQTSPSRFPQAGLVALRAGLDAITHRPNEPRAEYYQRILESPEALLVKKHDINDNTSHERMAALDAATRVRLTAKYAKARRELGLSV